MGLHVVGLISDTHGHLDDSILDLFEDVDAIVHAGDIGGEAILYELQVVAPVTAVRGNTDRLGPTWPLPESASLTVGGTRIHVVHDLFAGSLPALDEAEVLVFGHTHKPQVIRGKRQLQVNPGSASRPRAADGLRTVALLEIGPDRVSVRIETI